jgi:acetyltransferase-like isoleucine patch superfamily enzyme
MSFQQASPTPRALPSVHIIQLWLFEELGNTPQTNAVKSLDIIERMVKIPLNSRNVAKVDRTAVVENKRLLGPETHVNAGTRLIGRVQTGKGTFIDSNAIILGPAIIGKGTYVGPNCIIGFPTANELKELTHSRRLKAKKPTTVGENCIIRPGTTLYSNVEIANDVTFGHNVLVREDVTIGTATRIGTNVVIDGSTKIGAKVSIQTGVYICTYSTVEDGVFLGPCCVFTNDKYVAQKEFKLIGPTVKKGASIGANALLFPGITVGEGSIVGSQAMVNSDVPPRTVFVGIPAKKMRNVPDDWHSSLLASLNQSAVNRTNKY